MALATELLEILACPDDKGPLYYLEGESVLYNPRLRRRYEIRGAVGQALELSLEARREGVEGLLHEGIRCPRWHIAAGAGGEHVFCYRFSWILFEPFLQYLHAFVDFADHAVRQGE